MEANITLYSNNCANCKLLKEYLDNKGIEYNIVSDVNEILEKGYTAVPVLEINGGVYDRLDTAMMAVKTMLGDGE